jgi:hypothetical protein
LQQHSKIEKKPTKNPVPFNRCVERLKQVWNATPQRYAADRIEKLEKLISIWERDGYAVIEDAFNYGEYPIAQNNFEPLIMLLLVPFQFIIWHFNCQHIHIFSELEIENSCQASSPKKRRPVELKHGDNSPGLSLKGKILQFNFQHIHIFSDLEIENGCQASSPQKDMKGPYRLRLSGCLRSHAISFQIVP